MRRICSLLLITCSMLITACSSGNAEFDPNAPGVTPIVRPSQSVLHTVGTNPEGDDSRYHYIRYDYPLSEEPSLFVDSSTGNIIGTYENMTFDVEVLTDETNLPTVGVYEVVFHRNDRDTSFRGYSNASSSFYDYFIGMPSRISGEVVSDSEVKNTADSMRIVSASESECVNSFISMYDSKIAQSSPSILAFDVKTASLANSDCYIYPGEFNYNQNTTSLYIVRPEYESLPVTQLFPKRDTPAVISWDADRIVGFPTCGAWDQYCCDDSLMFCYRDFRIDYKDTVEEGLEVVPIENCIPYVISQIQHDLSDETEAYNGVKIFAAELSYCAVAQWDRYMRTGLRNCDGQADLYYWLLPTWVVYYGIETDEGMSRIGTSYLNASTGLGMELDYYEFEQYEENIIDYVEGNLEG